MCRHGLTNFQGWAAALCALGVAVLATPAEALSNVEPEVVAKYPHDSQAFTQGFLAFEGELYESTGLLGRSTLRRVALESGAVLQQVDLDPSEFGEGLARVGDRLIQLTWKSGVAHEYDLRTFQTLRSFSYAGEGWGLCFDGQRLVMSDGSAQLFFRNPDTFELLGTVDVTLEGQPVDQLNELECLSGRVLANVWQTDAILEIDLDTGVVLTQVDASGLLTSSERAGADVLNGIAHVADDRFYLTGKLWPAVFEVRLALAGDSTSEDAAGPVAAEPETTSGAKSSPIRSTSSPSCVCALGAVSPGQPGAPVAIGLLAVCSVLTRRQRRGAALRRAVSPTSKGRSTSA